MYDKYDIYEYLYFMKRIKLSDHIKSDNILAHKKDTTLGSMNFVYQQLNQFCIL